MTLRVKLTLIGICCSGAGGRSRLSPARGRCRTAWDVELEIGRDLDAGTAPGFDRLGMPAR
jgi:hypothetical protein